MSDPGPDYEFLDFTETDPLKLFVQIAKSGQIKRETAYSELDKTLIISYYYRLLHAATSLDVPFVIKEDVPKPNTYSGIERFYDRILDEVEKRKIDIALERVRSATAQKGIDLDDAWRQKVHSYIMHIRQVVTGAPNLERGLQQNILNRLNALGAEVDRRQTRIQSVSDVMVELCRGLSEGAEELRPAVTIVERLVGALVRLRGQPVRPLLPAPENLALPSIEAAEAPPEDAPPPK